MDKETKGGSADQLGIQRTGNPPVSEHPGVTQHDGFHVSTIETSLAQKLRRHLLWYLELVDLLTSFHASFSMRLVTTIRSVSVNVYSPAHSPYQSDHLRDSIFELN